MLRHVLKPPTLHYLCHVSFRRYSPLSVEVVKKRSKCKSFLVPSFLWEGRQY